ncbi:MAG: PLP-dependent aminotransferase family protein [Anaerovorax sp.]
MQRDAKAALSYSNTIGYDPLRIQIAERMKKNTGLDFEKEQVLLTSGSQQGLDLSGLLFIDKGDIVLFETPSYLGALNVLKVYEAQLVAVPTDEEGIITEALEEALKKYGERVKLVYVNPDYQNPTGRSWSHERRGEFIKLVSAYNIAVIEDGAYAELSFGEKRRLPLITYDQVGQVIYLGTFSKTFCPGLRIGWILANRTLIQQYLALKTNVDLSAASILQRQVSYYLESKDLDKHIGEITSLYKHRRDVMVKAIKTQFPLQVKSNVPEGGLFIWVELPHGSDTRELLKACIQENVAFVPGAAFYPHGDRNNEMRLNFSNVPDEDIERGITILGGAIKKYLENQQ